MAVPSFATDPADLLKIAILSWVMVFLINTGLRKAGLAQYTTKGS